MKLDVSEHSKQIAPKFTCSIELQYLMKCTLYLAVTFVHFLILRFGFLTTDITT